MTGIILALCVLAALVLYALAWRATRLGSLTVKALVRGGLPVLIVAPLVVVTLLGSKVENSFQKIDGQLSAPAPGETVPEQAEESESLRMDGTGNGGHMVPPSGGGGGRFGPKYAPRVPGGNYDPLDLPLLDQSPSLYEPTIVMPPTLPPAIAPKAPEAPAAAANGDHERGPGAPMTTPPPAAAKAPATPQPEERAKASELRAESKAEEEHSDWDVVPVFYGTDRAEEANPKRLAYSSERGRRLQIGRALVTVPKIHEVPQIERPWAIRIPYFDVTIYEEAEDPKRHFTMQELKKLPKEDFLQLVHERLQGSQRFKNHAIIFVHGYNTSFDNAIYRTAQISYDLKFDGAAFAYSWPSGGAVASYTYDRESAEASEPYLRQFLDLVVKETGAKSISVIAHSMGNQPLLEVLKDMKSAAPEGVVISQIILAAPDVDADNFANLARRIEGFATGVTLYAASNDRALIISRNFWQNPRAGDVTAKGPLIVPGIDTIDVTAASTEAFALNHSEYAENNALLQDIGKLILNGLRPPDQRFPSLKRVTTDKGDYWRYTAP